MKGELNMDVNDNLPVRDGVFKSIRQAIIRG